jgi:hypothetical protein
MPRKGLETWPDLSSQKIRLNTYHLSEISNLISNRLTVALIGESLKSSPHSGAGSLDGSHQGAWEASRIENS